MNFSRNTWYIDIFVFDFWQIQVYMDYIFEFYCVEICLHFQVVSSDVEADKRWSIPDCQSFTDWPVSPNAILWTHRAFGTNQVKADKLNVCKIALILFLLKQRLFINCVYKMTTIQKKKIIPAILCFDSLTGLWKITLCIALYPHQWAIVFS